MVKRDDVLDKVRHKLRTSWTPRGLLLFVLALPLLPALFLSLVRGDMSRTLVHLAAIVLFFGGALLVRQGLIAEALFEERRTAAAPPVPRKTMGGLAVAVATTLCAFFAVGQDLSFSLFLGALAFAGCFLAYGPDPRKDKGIADARGGVTNAEVAQVLMQAEEKIARIEDAGRRLGNTELRQRLEHIGAQARQILLQLEDDPRDIQRARKFLYVYLDGAQQVSEGYAAAHQHEPSGQLESNFRNVLVNIEEVFAEQAKRLRENEVLDVDVKIEALALQLKREGLN